MPKAPSKFFHLHMVSDASGETLAVVAKAATVQYSGVRALKHSHPFVRNKRHLDRVIQQIEAAPGIVLYTLVNRELGQELERHCEQLKVPCIAVLVPLLNTLEMYLGMPSTPVVGGQHILDNEYFRRIEAVNFTLSHDDGQMTKEVDMADIVLVGASRTSKTPTSLYLANRGYKTANVSLVPNIPIPPELEAIKQAFVVGLIASPQRLSEIRKNRLLSMKDHTNRDYIDIDVIVNEVAFTRRLCARNKWPIVDVTRRSIEETAASVIKLVEDKKDSEKARND
jgi:regulator of PEP synthase PpsR (kinase-PPPase family)